MTIDGHGAAAGRDRPVLPDFRAMKILKGIFTAMVLRRRRCTAFCVLLGISLALAACTTSKVWTGNSRPLVKDQPYEGAHRTMHYQLSFRYTFQPGANSEPDTIDFEGRLVPRRGLLTLTLRLLFLDASGKILAARVIYAPGGRQGAARTTIRRQIKVPEGAAKLGFRHVARERRMRNSR